jgi:hypothetical protein
VYKLWHEKYCEYVVWFIMIHTISEGLTLNISKLQLLKGNFFEVFCHVSTVSFIQDTSEWHCEYLTLSYINHYEISCIYIWTLTTEILCVKTVKIANKRIQTIMRSLHRVHEVNAYKEGPLLPSPCFIFVNTERIFMMRNLEVVSGRNRYQKLITKIHNFYFCRPTSC